MHEPSFFVDHTLILLLALLFNALLLGPRRWVTRAGLFRSGHAVSSLVRGLERRLNRERRSEADRARRGTLVTMGLTLAAAFMGLATLLLCERLEFGALIQVLLLALLLSVRQTADLAQAVGAAVEAGNGKAAREELSGTAWRNAALLDGYGLSRAAAETLSVHLTDRVFSPALCFLLLGLPGLFACAMLTLLADATSHAQAHFGKTAARAAGAMHYVPSLIASGALLLSSCCLPYARPLPAARAWLVEMADTNYRRRGPAVLGAALGVSLGGPGSVYAPGAWVGGEKARIGVLEVRRARTLFGLSVFLFVLGLIFFVR